MMYCIMYHIVALVSRWVLYREKMYCCSPNSYKRVDQASEHLLSQVMHP